jgi:NADH-quinone oxidoreductase subunit L
MSELVPFIPLFPLIGFFISGLLGKKIKSEWLIGIISSLSVGLSFLFTILIFIDLLTNPIEHPFIITIYKWIETGGLGVDISYQVDQLSVLFCLIITGVGFLIHVYSIGYMHGERSFARFFSYMNLFIFMMLNLVLASNLLLTFLGWEGVGLCSYLLIGFWYDRKFEGTSIKWTGDAGMKAFIVNRIGDFGFIIAMFFIYSTFNSLDYQTIMTKAAGSSSVLFGTGIITAISLLLFLGCTGKSAQIPLAVWLPDAMAGPTPVSALIHAATMVTGGIYLISRTSVLFALSPIAMNVVMIVGILTAIWAATIGLVQNDIKKVLAYSTVSQLGFMFAALGVGAFSAAVFHVMTHAFFKGLLFLGAGAIIHGMHDEQNIKNMGGLRKYMSTTYKTFIVAALAISGIPFFSGFFSKDEILWKVFESGGVFAWAILALAALCTAFYMFRLINLVFFGKERFDISHIHPHEAPASMTIPLIILAVLSALGGFLGIPLALVAWISLNSNLIESWLEPVFKSSLMILDRSDLHEIHSVEYLLMAFSVAVALFGIYLAQRFYSDSEWTIPRRIVLKFNTMYKLLLNKYYLDEVYKVGIVEPVMNSSRQFLWKIFDVKLIDGFVNGTAKVTIKAGEIIRRLQSGLAPNYALMMLGGIVVILLWLLLAM